jgi:predicted glycosyltransferase
LAPTEQNDGTASTWPWDRQFRRLAWIGRLQNELGMKTMTESHDGMPKPEPDATGHAMPKRVVLYSHDTMGLGHFRRNLLIARALTGSSLNVEALLIAGIHEAGGFTLPERVDCLTLPGYRKCAQGTYCPRVLSVSTDQLAGLRAAMIQAAIDRFDPELFIVDNVPRGAVGELEPILEAIRRRPGIRTVLGLRDIIDAPDATERQWRESGSLRVMERQYDAIWIYGDRNVFDAPSAYSMPKTILARIRYTGYLDQARRLDNGAPVETVSGDCEPNAPYVLCMVGGGQDGARVAEIFLRATLPEGLTRLVVTGPLMPSAERCKLTALAADLPSSIIRNFIPEPLPLMRRAAAIVTMGGYNTISEILSTDTPALVVPRTRPRREQIIRAERLHELGLIDYLVPDALTPGAIGNWLASAVLGRNPRDRTLDRAGLSRLPAYASDLLAAPRAIHALMTDEPDEEVHHHAVL